MAFKKGFDPYRKILTTEDRIKAVKSKRPLIDEKWNGIVALIESDQLVTKTSLRKYLMLHFGSACGHTEWNGQPLVQEFHHKDGNNKNHRLSNCEMLCPNCHSQTDTFRNKKRPDRQLADHTPSN